MSATPKPAKYKRVLVIADYGQQADDLAFWEVKQKLLSLDPSLQIDSLSVNAFDPVETALAIRKAIESGEYDAVYHNTAPRKDKKESRAGNDGEKLGYARVNANGKEVVVVGVASGEKDGSHAFAEVVNHFGAEVHNLAYDTHIPTQFRSLHLFPGPFIEAWKNPRSERIGEVLEGIQRLTQDADTAAARGRVEASFERLAQIQRRRSGNASAHYISVLSPLADDNRAEQQLQHVADAFPKAEVDLLGIGRGADNNPKSFAAQAGFAAAQLALTAKKYASKRTFILSNSADIRRADKDVYRVVLGNGATLITDDLKTLGFVRDHIATAQKRAGLENGTNGAAEFFSDTAQWQSVENIQAQIPAKTVLQSAAATDGKIPPIQGISVAYTDGYGNLKLSHSQQEVFGYIKTAYEAVHGANSLQENQVIEVKVTVTGADGQPHSIPAFISASSFGVKDGETAFSRGSSGWDGQYFAEVFLRGGNASAALENPLPGSSVTVEFSQVVELKPSPHVTGDDRQLSGGPSVAEKRAV